MSRKMMLLALAAVSAAMFALPAFASAAPVIEPGGTSFTGTFGSSTLEAKEEPTVTCEGENHVTGSFNAGGTGGTISLDYTNCHVVVIGVTFPCKTSGAPVNNTIALSAVPFDLVYTNALKSPGVLVTNVSTTVECSGISTIHVTGNVMGTVTSPKCGETKTSATLAFKATGSVQEHKKIEGAGTEFELKTETGTSGVKKSGGLNTNATITLAEGKSATLTCL